MVLRVVVGRVALAPVSKGVSHEWTPSGPLCPWETPFFERLKETRVQHTAKELAGLASRVETPGSISGGLPPTKRPRLSPARVYVSVDRERVLRAWLRVLRACPGAVIGRQFAQVRTRAGNQGLQLPLDESVIRLCVSHEGYRGCAYKTQVS
eukprot:1383339-Amphidinium_carterae.1